MSPTRREVLRTVGSVTALAATSAVAGCNTFQNSNDVHTGPATVKAADVPVGGGVVIDGTNFVVTQPTKGTWDLCGCVRTLAVRSTRSMTGRSCALATDRSSL